MDILLIYPSISINERYGNKRLGNVGGHLPPLGIAYIAACLRDAGFDVGIIDGPVCNLKDNDILNKIQAFKPKVIGISAITPVFNNAVRLANLVRDAFASVLIIIGGHHASILPMEVLKENPCFDLLVIGEGELTCCEIMQKYKRYDFDRERLLKDIKFLNEINGVAFRKSEEIVMTHPRSPIENLDTLPYPAWDLLPMKKYIPLPNQYLRQPVIHMVAIRGCPYQCSFCSNNSVFGKKIRAVSPKRVIEIIKYAKYNFGAREISFWDDCMTVNKEWMLEFCQLMVKEGIDVIWSCCSRVDTVNKKLLFWMKKAGCWNIFYGYETAHQELLDIIDKNITLDDIIQANQWTKEAGIEIRASFMIALPQETPQMTEKTIEFAISLEPDYAQFSITTPFPGTKLYEDAKRYGTILKDFSTYTLWGVNFIPAAYRNKKQVETAEKTDMRRFYFRFKYIYGRLRKIRSFSDILRYFKGLKMAIGLS